MPQIESGSGWTTTVERTPVEQSAGSASLTLKRDRLAFRAYASVALLGVGLFTWWNAAHPYVIDDAYISFRYARHAAQGQGPVYNPGDQPVEGYTSPLWMWLMASGFLLRVRPEMFSLVCSGISGVGVIVLFAWWCRRILFTNHACIFAVLWLTTNYSFLTWGSGGLETMTHTLTTLCTVIAFAEWNLDTQRRNRIGWASLAGAISFLNVFCRPEGAALLALQLFALVLIRPRLPPTHTRTKSVTAFCISALIPTLAFLAWRWTYYGSLLPNTFFAKATDPNPAAGLRYIMDFLEGVFLHPLLSIPAIGAACVLLRKAPPMQRVGFIACSVFIAMHLLYIVAVGGDIFEFRFMVQVLPILALWLAFLFENVASTGGLGAAAVMGAVFMLAVNAHTVYHRGYTRSYEGPETSATEDWRHSLAMRDWRMIGEWLAKYARPNESVAVRAAGILPYTCDLRTLDMHGLNDAHIAHSDGVYNYGPGHKKMASSDYVESWRPTYMVGTGILDTKVVNCPGALCVRVSPGMYFTFRTADEKTDDLARKLRARGAEVVSPATHNTEQSLPH